MGGDLSVAVEGLRLGCGVVGVDDVVLVLPVATARRDDKEGTSSGLLLNLRN